ncbi:MAG: hypothetical protein IKG93_02710 [Clostridiales bacterium]|nr:hypothetical protein [Clostridiales bacterium]
MLISQVETELKTCPNGHLHLRTSHNYTQFYKTFEHEGIIERTYLGSSQKELVEKLARKEYLERLIKEMKIEIADIERFLAKDTLLRSNNVFSNFREEKRNLIEPLLLDDETYARRWQNQPYDPYLEYPEALVYPTKRGELVRSKSEAMMADVYFELNIPYKYECPIILSNGEVLHDDFTVLHVTERKEYYHEHLGLLDDPRYLIKNMKKLDLYRRNGIYVGKNLILTHEIRESPFNVNVFRRNTMEMFGIHP